MYEPSINLRKMNKIIFIVIGILFACFQANAQEKITVPAGTYDCYLMTYQTFTKMGPGKLVQDVKLWISDAVGQVKIEGYIRNKLNSTTELESVN
jgi:hypothetical protein